jgi:antitoxin component HigA of HigAB toxin-antitoxin module
MWLLQAATGAHQTSQAGTPHRETIPEKEQRVVSRTKTEGRPAVLPDTYFELVKKHPLTTIRNEAQLDAAQAVMDGLLRQELDEGGLAYLDALSDLVILYEQDHHALAPLPPHELLAHMLEERSMSQADLVRATGLAKATVSDLVGAKRRFTVDQMHLVAKVFGLPGSVFMPKAASPSQR